jgi:phosphoribosylformylglycinamidine synthase
VGIVDDVHNAVSQGFKNEGDIILLLGKTKEELNGTEYLRALYGKEEGIPPQIDLAAEKKVQDFCIEAAAKKLIASANDISEGGLAVCLAESVFSAEAFLGCEVSLKDSIRTDALFFGETQSRIIVTVEPENLDTVLDLAGKRDIPITRIGKVNGQKIFIRHGEKPCIEVPVALAYNTWKNAIPKIFQIKS